MHHTVSRQLKMNQSKRRMFPVYNFIIFVHYANPRKRQRAAELPPETLPGFEATGGAFQIHPACSRRDLTWLRHLVYRLVRRGQVEKRREKRPDLRQARGWDWMSTLYPLNRKDD